MVWGFIFVTILAICVVAGVLIFLRNRDRQILLASELYEQTRDLLHVSHSMFYCGDELVSEYRISCAVSSEEAFLEFEPDDYMRAYVAAIMNLSNISWYVLQRMDGRKRRYGASLSLC